MKPRRYKYCSEVEYAEDLLQGRMYRQTLAYFRDFEDPAAQQIIGDEYEGTRIYRPVDGLQVNHLTQGTSGVLQKGLECLTKAHEIYVFCISLSLTEQLKREFHAKACVEILDPGEFVGRWIRALPKDAKHVARRVGYYRPQDLPGSVWALPDLIATTKLDQFAYQEEYRLAYTTTDALAFENCTYLLVDRKDRPSPKPDEHLNQTLYFGDLRDICRVHVFK